MTTLPGTEPLAAVVAPTPTADGGTQAVDTGVGTRIVEGWLARRIEREPRLRGWRVTSIAAMPGELTLAGLDGWQVRLGREGVTYELSASARSTGDAWALLSELARHLPAIDTVACSLPMEHPLTEAVAIDGPTGLYDGPRYGLWAGGYHSSEPTVEAACRTLSDVIAIWTTTGAR